MYDSYVKRFKVKTSNVQRFKVNVQRFKLTFKGLMLLTLREDRIHPRQFISIISLELVSTTLEVRTQ
jgi:hypothetical protein